MLRRLLLTAISVLLIGLVAQRIWQYATFEQQSVRMPRQVADAEEQQLFSSPAGAYSLADIEANGKLLPSQKFRGFLAQHDFQPQPGDRLCPITRTKSHRECTWIVGGQTYEFCCPPCISEFVRHAKAQPDHILPPEAYIQQR